MSERERWVIYPLLFLALGAALRDKLFDRTMTRSIVCQELTVVDGEPLANREVRILAKIGRSEPTPGTPPIGYLFVNGQVDVHGAINARQYAYRGVPFVPALQAVFPGVTLPADWWRAVQQAAQAAAPADGSDPPPDSPPARYSDPPEPLADPADNR